ncbi:MAG: class I SAM-dependent methyltransferase [Bacteroidota bacterium]
MESAYYHTPESVAEYIKMAEGFNGQELIDQLQVHLPPGSQVLELGTGPGTDWQILSKAYTVTGSDLSAEFLKHLQTTHPKGHFLELDAATLETNQTFDGIYSNKVLHHLQDEALQQSISRQAHVLNPKGILCHSFWKGEGSEVFKGMYVNYHQGEELAEVFGQHFDILALKAYAEFEENDSFLLIARKLDS